MEETKIKNLENKRYTATIELDTPTKNYHTLKTSLSSPVICESVEFAEIIFENLSHIEDLKNGVTEDGEMLAL